MSSPDPHLDLLVFRAGETRFGLDAEQIAEVLSLEDLEVVPGGPNGPPHLCRAGVEIPLVDLASMKWGQALAHQREAKLVLPKEAPPPAAFVIGDPEEMLRVETGAVEALPPMIRSMVRGSGIWAAARSGDGLVILIDLAEAAEAVVSRRESAAAAS